MKISKIELPFLACERSKQIECSDVDKDTAKGIAVSLGYVVQGLEGDLEQGLEGDLEFFQDGEVIGALLENGDFSLFIDEGSEAETKYLSLGGENWIKKLLTSRTNPV